MKIRGQVFDKPKPVTVILPYGDANILILCESVPSFAEFELMCPTPEPPKALKPGGVQSVDMSDKKFLLQIGEHSQLRTYWMIKESLRATPSLEWEKIDDTKPETWQFLDEELTKAFGQIGVSKIIQAVLRANGLSDEIVGEARDSFLASQSLLQNG